MRTVRMRGILTQAKRIYVPGELLTRRRRWLRSNFRFGDARRSYRSPSEYSSTRARPVVWRALLSESRPPLSRKGIMSFKVHQFVDLSHGRRRHWAPWKDIHVLSMKGPSSRFCRHGQDRQPRRRGFRASTTKDQSPRVRIFLSLCHIFALSYF